MQDKHLRWAQEIEIQGALLFQNLLSRNALVGSLEEFNLQYVLLLTLRQILNQLLIIMRQFRHRFADLHGLQVELRILKQARPNARGTISVRSSRVLGGQNQLKSLPKNRVNPSGDTTEQAIEHQESYKLRQFSLSDRLQYIGCGHF